MSNIQTHLRSLQDTKRSVSSMRFFKTGVWEYGEGDIFLGITVPETRKIVKQYEKVLGLSDIKDLLMSPYHEERLAWVIILAEWAKKKRYPLRDIATFYMNHRERINNWDLVDVSAEHIIWPYIEEILTHEKRQEFIDSCINSHHLWTNRIIVLASFYQIKKWNEKLTFYIVAKFLHHPHDLMHKACGWMLREVGKRINMNTLSAFLDMHGQNMPRTMLRYALEHYDEETRKKYMQK